MFMPVTIQYNTFIYTQLKLKLKSLWGRVQINKNKNMYVYVMVTKLSSKDALSSSSN